MRQSAFLRTFGWLIAMAVSGCHSEPRNPMGMDFRDTYYGHNTVVTDSSKIPVAMGRLPLAYMLNTPQRVRVTDYESGKTLAEANGTDGTIIYLDAVKGVLVDGKVVRPGTLDSNDRYGIYFEPK